MLRKTEENMSKLMRHRVAENHVVYSSFEPGQCLHAVVKNHDMSSRPGKRQSKPECLRKRACMLASDQPDQDIRPPVIAWRYSARMVDTLILSRFGRKPLPSDLDFGRSEAS